MWVPKVELNKLNSDLQGKKMIEQYCESLSGGWLDYFPLFE